MTNSDETNMIQPSYDCIVMGAGPAGSTVAALVAEAGHSTLLIERERFPRDHIGESLMPETYWTLKRLGVLEQMKQSDFVKKVSIQFVSGGGRESQPFFFDQHDPRECSQTWQVERARFDQMLFDNAATKGAECVDGTRVLDVVFDGDRVIGVRIQAGGKVESVSARVVADATGQSTLLANKLGLRESIPELRKSAIWTYYVGAERAEGPHGGATVILHTESKDAWFWVIPLSGGRTSVGLVGDVDYIFKRGKSVNETFADELDHCPALQRRLTDATPCDEFSVAKEFSYTTSQHAGAGWVLVGDAFGFIDPIYSSGVYFALKMGELAADAINEGLKTNQLDEATLGSWTQSFESGSLWIRKLVAAYYDPEFSIGQFMRQHPEHASCLTDVLIGRIFSGNASKMFDDMPAHVRNVG
jgi:flavin-dependent dehydrogenase